MIEGVRLLAQGIGNDGDMFDPRRVIVALGEAVDSNSIGPDLEITLESGDTWSVPLRDFRDALTFAEQQYWRDRDPEGPEEPDGD
jgi:hypothetical protein